MQVPNQEQEGSEMESVDPACWRLFKCWGTPVVDLFASWQTQGVPNTSVWLSHTKEHLRDMC